MCWFYKRWRYQNEKNEKERVKIIICLLNVGGLNKIREKREKEREKEKVKERDRQTVRQTDRLKDRQTDRDRDT